MPFRGTLWYEVGECGSSYPRTKSISFAVIWGTQYAEL